MYRQKLFFIEKPIALKEFHDGLCAFLAEEECIETLKPETYGVFPVFQEFFANVAVFFGRKEILSERQVYPVYSRMY